MRPPLPRRANGVTKSIAPAARVSRMLDIMSVMAWCVSGGAPQRREPTRATPDAVGGNLGFEQG